MKKWLIVFQNISKSAIGGQPACQKIKGWQLWTFPWFILKSVGLCRSLDHSGAYWKDTHIKKPTVFFLAGFTLRGASGNPEFRRHLFDFLFKMLFSSILMFFDIGSDIFTGFYFLESGNPKWATFTFLIILAPWLARFIILIANIPNCFQKSSSFGLGISQEGLFLWKEDLRDTLLDFPLFQPFR